MTQQVESINAAAVQPTAGTAHPAPHKRPALMPSDPLLALQSLLRLPVPIVIVAERAAVDEGGSIEEMEVDALRARGWAVRMVTLCDVHQMAIGIGRELLSHPLDTLRTFAAAARDALAPGERTSFMNRLRALGSGMAGICLANQVREHGHARHVHCQSSRAATAGMYAASQLGVRFSFSAQGNEDGTLLKRKLERAAFVACANRSQREEYRKISPADETFYPLVHRGVNMGLLDADDLNGRHFTTQRAGIVRVLTLAPADVAIRAMNRFGETTGRFWQLTIAGNDDRRAARLIAGELGVSDRVDFVDADRATELRDLLRGSDLFVVSADRNASQTNALTMALSIGIPVIAPDAPAMRELLLAKDGAAGVLVPSDDPAALAGAIEKLSNEPSLRRSLIAGGRGVMAREFDFELNVSRLERMLEATVRRTDAGSNDAAAAGGAKSRRYALITPCRDEAKYARRTLDSVTSQSIPPAVWVIVDDGSKDETPHILAEYAARFRYIKIVTRADRGDRKLGGGVIDAFYAGYETINPDDYDYVCKLDLDLDLPRRYFETLMERMEQSPRIGTCSGKPYFTRDGQQVSEKCGDEASVGMVKFYRTECFKQIGGFVRELMWDGIDCHQCRMNGWLAVSWDDPAINFEHLRPMGTSHKNWWTGRARHGSGQYFMGTGPIY
ncbi:MAG TPA: glycosyltransferase, partial [Tepidisphaeraceae bacterium]|nr:glycosyltransferase [Tepidisphaeraceae bacterium]